MKDVEILRILESMAPANAEITSILSKVSKNFIITRSDHDRLLELVEINRKKYARLEKDMKDVNDLYLVGEIASRYDQMEMWLLDIPTIEEDE